MALVFRRGLFAGKTAIVSGGGSGIGKDVARQLLGLGANVLLASRDEAKLAAAARVLRAEVDDLEHVISDHDTARAMRRATPPRDACERACRRPRRHSPARAGRARPPPRPPPPRSAGAAHPGAPRSLPAPARAPASVAARATTPAARPCLATPPTCSTPAPRPREPAPSA